MSPYTTHQKNSICITRYLIIDEPCMEPQDNYSSFPIVHTASIKFMVSACATSVFKFQDHNVN